MIFRRKNNLLAMKWKDKKDVSFLSTSHSATMVNSRTRRDANGIYICIPHTNVLGGGGGDTMVLFVITPPPRRQTFHRLHAIT